MQLFEKWQSAIDTYKSFYEETEHLWLEVVTFLKHFCEANDTISNTILKMFDTAQDFMKACKRGGSKHLLKKQINKAKECLSLVKQYRDNKRAVWIRKEHRKRFYLP